MGYRLGVDLGTSFTAATIGRAGSTHGTSLGADSAVVPSVVYIGTDGARLYGSAAADLAGAQPERVLRGFLRRIGDETPMLPEAGASTAAHRIAADFVAWVVDQASVQEGRAPESVAITHPATWGPHKRNLLALALREAGVPGVTLVAEPVAAATVGTAGGTYASGAIVAVYDLGGRTFDASLVRRNDSGAWTSIGRPAGLPDLGGTDLDDLVLAHVISGLSPDQQQALAQLDAEDEATAAALTGLRAACVQAKETLSAETVTTVEVKLPGISSSVRVTRAEFEALAATPLEATMDVMDSVLNGAGITTADVDAILISGGSSRIPLVTQMLSSQFQLPVINAGRQSPATAIAAGAVLALGEIPAAPVKPVVRVVQEAATPAAKAGRKSKAAKVSASSAPAAAVPAPAKPIAPVATPAPVASVPAVRVAPVAPAAKAPAAPAPKAPAAPAKAPVAPAAKASAVEHPLPNPSGPSSKPIRPHRGARRAEVVGLEGLTPVARVAVDPAIEGPRSVISPRAVRSVDALLVEDFGPAARMEQLPPPRPALDDYGFTAIEDLELEALQASWTWRSMFSVKRVLALGVLTGAIFVGSTAWIPATPTITDKPVTDVKAAPAKVAPAKHAKG